jgi:phytoene synthase
MSKYYHAILDLLERRGFQPPRQSVRLSKASKIAILIRYALI